MSPQAAEILAAGIGGGYGGSGGTITIHGGKVKANGGDAAAGIGGGRRGSGGDDHHPRRQCHRNRRTMMQPESAADVMASGGTVTIHGGSVTATGGDSAAGIGGGIQDGCWRQLCNRNGRSCPDCCQWGYQRYEQSGKLERHYLRGKYWHSLWKSNHSREYRDSIGQNADRTEKHHPDREGRRDPHQ